MSSTPDKLYPLATALGVAIPLDVGKPKGSFRIEAHKLTALPLVLPDELNLVSCYFADEVFITLGSAVASIINTYQADSMYLLGGIVYDIVLPKNINIQAVHKDNLGYINVIQTWTQLQNQNYEAS